MKIFVTVVASAILLYVALLVTQEPQAPEISPAEEACIEETNAALERAGQQWASMTERAGQLDDEVMQVRLINTATEFYETMIENILRRHDACVARQEALNALDRL